MTRPKAPQTEWTSANWAQRQIVDDTPNAPPEREMCPECGLKHFPSERPSDCIAANCPYRMLGAYFQNSRKVLLKKLVNDRRAAEARATRWLNAHGEVGCYDDLVAVIHMYDDLIAVIDDPA